MAVRVGEPSVRHLVSRGLTSRELAELLAYDWLEPDAGRRTEEGFAMLTGLVYNKLRGKNEPRRRVEEFLPERGPRDPTELQNKLLHKFRMMRGKG